MYEARVGGKVRGAFMGLSSGGQVDSRKNAARYFLPSTTIAEYIFCF